MVQNLETREIYNFIVNDFREVWNSVANNNKEKIARGNFMFAQQATNLLEFIGRACMKNNDLLKEFAEELKLIEPRYFTEIPGNCDLPRDFSLPSLDKNPTNKLLSVLYDLIRNGLAHQYQQIIAHLHDGKFAIELTGPSFGQILGKSIEMKRKDNLNFYCDIDGDLTIIVHPDILFLDFKKAINKVNLVHKTPDFDHLTRPRKKSPRKVSNKKEFYDFTISDLKQYLLNGNHIKIKR